jgi:hypothetical protein
MERDMTSELFDAKKKESDEQTMQLMGAWLQKLTDRMVAHIRLAMESRRYPNGSGEEEHPRQLSRGLHIHNNEGGSQKEPSWQKWVLGIVALMIVGWLERLSLKTDKLIEVVVTQQEQEKRLSRLECTTYKICSP